MKKPTQQRITSLLATIVLAFIFCAMIAHCGEKPDSAKTPTTTPASVLTQAQLQQEINSIQQQAIVTQSDIYEKTENLKSLFQRMAP